MDDYKYVILAEHPALVLTAETSGWIFCTTVSFTRRII